MGEFTAVLTLQHSYKSDMNMMHGVRNKKTLRQCLLICSCFTQLDLPPLWYYEGPAAGSRCIRVFLTVTEQNFLRFI